MSRNIISVGSAIVALLGSSFAAVSQAEDCRGFCEAVPGNLLVGNPYDRTVANTRAGGLLLGLRGRFAVSVAYIGSTEVKGRERSKCGPVKVRIDEVYDAGNGELGLNFGETQTMKPWTLHQEDFRNTADDNNGVRGDLAERSVVGYRLRTELPARGCNVVASGMFYPEGGDGSVVPTPFALLPSTGR